MAWGAARRVFAELADLVLPNACLACRTAETVDAGLCGPCNSQLLNLASTPYCPRCGATIGPNIPVRDDGCWNCPRTLPRFKSVVRLGPYTGSLRIAIRELKYRRRETMRHRMGIMLAVAAEARLAHSPPDVIIPVPMHWRRRLARGCDHSDLLARTVAKRMDLPLGRELIRVRHTRPQVHMSRSKRLENVRDAFAVKRQADIAGARILLVDDVTTTGATAAEATRALLSASAGSVHLAVIAKAESPSAYADHFTAT